MVINSVHLSFLPRNIYKGRARVDKNETQGLLTPYIHRCDRRPRCEKHIRCSGRNLYGYYRGFPLSRVWVSKECDEIRYLDVSVVQR